RAAFRAPSVGDLVCARSVALECSSTWRRLVSYSWGPSTHRRVLLWRCFSFSFHDPLAATRARDRHPGALFGPHVARSPARLWSWGLAECGRVLRPIALTRAPRPWGLGSRRTAEHRVGIGHNLRRRRNRALGTDV